MRIFLFLLSLFCFSCNESADTSANSLQPQVSEPVCLATDMQFTEGPAWCEDGYLLFSDINGDVIYKWDSDSGVTPFVSSVQNSNGIVYGDGVFMVCRHGARDLAQLSKSAILTSYISTYNGKKFNSPNDIVISRNGNIYFTDPDYGVSASDRELNFEGLFFLAKGSKSPILIDDSMLKPNGVALSFDQTHLFVTESSTNSIYCFDILANGFASNKRLFCRVTGRGEVDGIECDKDGYLFVAFGDGGLVLISPEGKQCGIISFPEKEKVRNLCMGNGALFVTAGKSLYRVDFIPL